MTARSIHIGLNSLDPRAYRGFDGRLRSCESDARAMQLLCLAQGLSPRQILTAEATRDRVLGELRQAAAELTGGDLVVVTYAGHGASFEDRTRGEDDRRDEAWCLYDGYLIDDEIHAALTQFVAGVRVFVVSDSCFSGTVTRIPKEAGDPHQTPTAPLAASAHGRDRRLRRDLADAVYRANRAVYEQRKASVAAAQAHEPAASVLLLGACQDSQTAQELPDQGVFTAALLAVWDRGAFVGDHRALHARVRDCLPATQVPSLYPTGATDPAFVAARPFTP